MAAGASVKAAVNLGEQVNKVGVVFRGSEKDVLKWSESTAEALGLSSRQALEAAGTFGNMLVPMGFARDKAADMSKAMVGLAADMASFNNASPEDTLLALRAGLAGETEPLRRFGVFLNQARIEEEALALGISDGTTQLTAAQKAQATYAVILKDTADTQGDFGRTSESLANQQRIIRAQFEDAAAQLGTSLIPLFSKFAKGVSEATMFMREHETATKVLFGVLGVLGGTIVLVNAGMKIHNTMLTLGKVANALFTRSAVAKTAAEEAQTVATVAATRAHRALNLTLLANPIALTVAALAALGVVLVVAWRRSETFRNVVKAVFETVGAAVAGFAIFFTKTLPGAFTKVINWTKANWPKIATVIAGPFAPIVALATDAFGVRTKLINALKAIPSAALEIAKDIGKKIVDGIVGGITGLPGRLKGAVEGGLRSALGALNPFSTVEEGGARFIGMPLAKGTIGGWVFGSAELPQRMADTVRAAVERARQEVDRQRSVLGAAFGGLADKAGQIFDEVTNQHLTASEKKIAAIEQRRRREDMLQAVTDAKTRLAEARRSGDRSSIIQAEQALARAQEDIVLTKLQSQADRERKDYEVRRQLQKEAMQKRLEALQNQLAKEGATWQEAMARIAKTLRASGADFSNAGAVLGAAFAQAMRAAAAGVATGAVDVREAGIAGAADVQTARREDRARRKEEARRRRIRESIERENALRAKGGLPPIATAFAHGGAVMRGPVLGLLGETAASRPEIVAPEPVMAGVFRKEIASAFERLRPAAQERMPGTAGGGGDVTVNQYFTRQPDDPAAYLRQSAFAARTAFG